MEDDISQKNTTYATKEVAERLGIKAVTVRKYTQELEEKGYYFEKNESNWRIFYADDIKALAYLQVLRNQGKSFTESAEKVAELHSSGLSYRVDDTAIQNKDIKDDMQSFREQQEKFNKELLNRLDQQQQYIENRLNERDKNLMQVLNQLQEQKRLEQEEKKKKKWWKFWE